MAKRGTPIPWETRERIKRLAEDRIPQRMIAAGLGLNKETVNKYARKFRTK